MKWIFTFHGSCGQVQNGWRIATVFCTYSYAAPAVERQICKMKIQNPLSNIETKDNHPFQSIEEAIGPRLHHRLLIITMPPKVRVKIPIHVLVYSLGFFPAAAYGEISIVRIPFGV